MRNLRLLSTLFLGLALNACGQNKSTEAQTMSRDIKKYPEAKTSADWRKILSAEAYEIMVNSGTETPYKNPFWNNHKKGIYVSAATGKPLFSSDTKFESGTGWPSFFKPIDPSAIKIVGDTSDGMVRDEVVEASTGLHLGHVFDDGPKPTGLRYCMNSYALKFVPSK
ncbi:peptide-methionine (R)-S-oxide reductase MsrB [Pedobacter sandarakinus]|uniref:peptide-methionine (R)-S-oxide reductase MsrB n=1 Tax=Pedobacter sandarakinus TaxID=353156 RepID=UPI0022466EC9|nr:peptide-methionine (R)-S-oxide reductase MsrB [Pedobacter sandarakinus]MCX2575315.1 peptide-methionine (R)-S-oxide reductase MsrB [Pedobacter sandarakinus]